MKVCLKIAIVVYVLAVLFLSVGCLKMDQAPITHLYVVDVQNNVCAKRLITDKKTLSSRWVEDMPLEACDGNVSLSMQEYLNLRTFIRGKK
mgnify:CR=1 FL=1